MIAYIECMYTLILLRCSGQSVPIQDLWDSASRHVLSPIQCIGVLDYGEAGHLTDALNIGGALPKKRNGRKQATDDDALTSRTQSRACCIS